MYTICEAGKERHYLIDVTFSSAYYYGDFYVTATIKYSVFNKNGNLTSTYTIRVPLMSDINTLRIDIANNLNRAKVGVYSKKLFRISKLKNIDAIVDITVEQIKRNRQKFIEYCTDIILKNYKDQNVKNSIYEYSKVFSNIKNDIEFTIAMRKVLK